MVRVRGMPWERKAATRCASTSACGSTGRRHWTFLQVHLPRGTSNEPAGCPRLSIGLLLLLLLPRRLSLEGSSSAAGTTRWVAAAAFAPPVLWSILL